MNVILYVLGAPGVGKTTLVRELLGSETELVPSPKWTIGQDHVAAGHYKGETFDGGDTVAYNGARACLEFWNASLRPMLEPDSLTILDGDRFSSAPSLEYLRSLGGVLVVGVHLQASTEALQARCAARGSKQNEAWMRGRITKARNFADKIGAYGVNADLSAAQVFEGVLRYVQSVQSFNT